MTVQKKVWMIISIFLLLIVGLSIGYAYYVEGSTPKTTTTLDHFEGRVDGYQYIVASNTEGNVLYTFDGERKKDLVTYGVLATDYAIFYYQNENGRMKIEEEDAQGNSTYYETPDNLIVPFGKGVHTFSLSQSGRYLYIQQGREGAGERIGILYDRKEGQWKEIPLGEELSQLPDENRDIYGGWKYGATDVLSISIKKSGQYKTLRAQYEYNLATEEISNEMNLDVQLYSNHSLNSSNMGGVMGRNAINDFSSASEYEISRELRDYEKKYWPDDQLFEKEKDGNEVFLTYINRNTGERKEVLRWSEPGKAHATYAQFIGKDTGIALITVHGVIGLLDLETGDYAELLNNKSEFTKTFIVPPVTK